MAFQRQWHKNKKRISSWWLRFSRKSLYFLLKWLNNWCKLWKLIWNDLHYIKNHIVINNNQNLNNPKSSSNSFCKLSGLYLTTLSPLHLGGSLKPKVATISWPIGFNTCFTALNLSGNLHSVSVVSDVIYGLSILSLTTWNAVLLLLSYCSFWPPQYLSWQLVLLEIRDRSGFFHHYLFCPSEINQVR